MKKRIVSLLLALALLVLPVLPAFAAEEDSYTYVALGDSITTGVGLKDTHFSSTAKSYDVQENYHDYSKDCYVGPLLHRPKLFRVITPATRAAPKKRVR